MQINFLAFKSHLKKVKNNGGEFFISDLILAVLLSLMKVNLCYDNGLLMLKSFKVASGFKDPLNCKKCKYIRMF